MVEQSLERDSSELDCFVQARLLELLMIACVSRWQISTNLAALVSKWVAGLPAVAGVLLFAYRRWFETILQGTAVTLPVVMMGVEATSLIEKDTEGPARRLLPRVWPPFHAVVDAAKQEVVLFRAKDEGTNYETVPRILHLPNRRNRDNDFAVPAPFKGARGKFIVDEMSDVSDSRRTARSGT